MACKEITTIKKKKELARKRAEKRWNKCIAAPAEETTEMQMTASQKKLNLFQIDKCEQFSSMSSYTIVSDDVWVTLLKELKCDYCHEKSLRVDKSTELGFSTKLQLVCGSCENQYASTFSSSRVPQQMQFCINKDMVEAFLKIGKGYSAMEKFSMALGLKPMDQKTFDKYMVEFSETMKNMKHEVLEKS